MRDSVNFAIGVSLNYCRAILPWISYVPISPRHMVDTPQVNSPPGVPISNHIWLARTVTEVTFCKCTFGRIFGRIYRNVLISIELGCWKFSPKFSGKDFRTWKGLRRSIESTPWFRYEIAVSSGAVPISLRPSLAFWGRNGLESRFVLPPTSVVVADGASTPPALKLDMERRAHRANGHKWQHL